jgi:hypothetical protein
MSKSNEWKSKQIVHTFKAFCNKFGKLDDHSKLVLEAIFEEIHGRKHLPLLGSQRQKRDQSSNGLLGRRANLPNENS